MHIVFVLLPGYSALSLISALECLRIANRVAGDGAVRWTIMTETGAPVEDSLGASFPVDAALGPLARDDIAVVVAGVDVETSYSGKLLGWLRERARRGQVLGGLCTAAHVLAGAGVLEGRRATIHWENAPGFAETFPDITLADQVFVADDGRLTSAGGTAGIDMMLHLITRSLGQSVSDEVAARLIYGNIRALQQTARLSLAERLGIRAPRIAPAIELMERHVEEPLTPGEIAAEIGLSVRQLERLFQRYVGAPPKQVYLELRLTRAQQLLMQTDMKVVEIAVACGFNTTSHFSRRYRARFGETPHRARHAVKRITRRRG